MSSTTTSIVLKEYERNDKTRSINLRIIHNRKIAYISLNVFVTEDEWDPIREQIDKKKCKRYKNVARINDYLLQKKLDANEIINNLLHSGKAEFLSAAEVKKEILNIDDNKTLSSFTSQIVEEMKRAGKFGNASIYESTLSFVKRNNNGLDMNFQQINHQFLKRLEANHFAAGNTVNALSVYMRTLRAIYNRAIKENVVKKEWYPFDKYSIKNSKTKKRAISRLDIQKIEELKPEVGTQEFHARNFFLFSFYMIGLNFADMAHLLTTNILKGRLEYTRLKTNKNYSIALYDKPLQILDYYKKGKGRFDYIFPIISRDEPELIRKDIRNGLKTYNKYLRKIAKKLEIEGDLTSYVARHSWATIGKHMNIPIQVISEGLGHDSIQTTQVYLDSFDKNVIDEASRLIIG